MDRKIFLAALASVGLAAIAIAPVGAPAQSASPYVPLQDRALKAVPPERVAGLLQSAGLGYALTAELNGYPGPMHVLELAAELKLTAEQAERTRGVMEAMKAEGRALGERLVEAETHLERMFQMRHIDAERLRSQTAAIGAIDADLRRAHLAAHLEMMKVLTPEQVAAYSRLRGYGDASPGSGGHGQGQGQGQGHGHRHRH